MSLRQASASSQGEPGAAQEKWTDMNIEATSIPEDRPSPDSEGSREELGERNELMQGLSERHIQMIALAGTIGTGLFLGSGTAILYAGPLGALLGYLFVGILVSGVVMSIAELSALLPLSGGIIRHAEHFVDPALSFAQGWNFTYACAIALPAEMIAAAVVVSFWNYTISPAAWVTLFGGLVILSNLLFVRVYGELEFTFASLKILLIIGLNLMAIVLVSGGGPDHDAIGFKYWRDPGPFVQFLGVPGSWGNFLGFWATFTSAVYSFSGIESISMAAAETKSPRRNIPIAAKRILWRIGLFYVISIFFIGMLVPSDDRHLLTSTGTAASSPFVIAAQRAGVKVVPSIINAVVLTSAWSAGNGNLLGSSRTLYGMAREGHAPRVFLRLSRMKVPYVSVLSMGVFVALGYMSVSAGATTAFLYLQALCAVTALVTWINICIVYLRFYYGCRAQGIDRDELPWKGPLQPYAAWTSLVAFGVMLLTGGFTAFMRGHWSTGTFLAAYINIPIFLCLYLGYKFAKKTSIIPLSEIPIRPYLDIAKANPEPPAARKAGWRKLNFIWG